ncbi:GNAT family N-acetyltransferase [Acidithiobacillus ferriphilus]|uniref:GNAT family N-acetyltransferase n=1 Tax=Acidithiobacillus ferriphilus TaxID=1689834 RepID=UPI001C073CE2|nr:N-acetyltransferase [Acidithiobacillus ferriphilus]MBU2854277.1 GNAT family N-acetyltransferase [Acidithiobacillus ferriphilus]
MNTPALTKARPASHANTIREAGLRDLDALTAIENQCFSIDRISRSGLRRFLAHGSCTPAGGCTLQARARILVVENGTHVCGYVLLLMRQNSRIARIYSLAVAPEHRQMGMARTLLACTESVAMASGRNRIRLEVREDNAAAIRLYTSVGYRPFDRIASYYEAAPPQVDRTAAIRMEKLI